MKDIKQHSYSEILPSDEFSDEEFYPQLPDTLEEKIEAYTDANTGVIELSGAIGALFDGNDVKTLQERGWDYFEIDGCGLLLPPSPKYRNVATEE